MQRCGAPFIRVARHATMWRTIHPGCRSCNHAAHQGAPYVTSICVQAPPPEFRYTLRRLPIPAGHAWRHAGGMPNYRRIKTPGGTFFFTVNLFDRRKRLLVEHIDSLREAFRLARHRRPFRIIAIVVLPDHLHCIWQLQYGDSDNARRWAIIKSEFSRRLPCAEWRSPARVRRRERGIWQRRFWERVIEDEADLNAHIGYIHRNPVKHGLAASATDWPYSSLNRQCGVHNATACGT